MLCLISDTHENIPVIRKAVEKIKILNPELVIHCGDIVSPPILEEFRGLPMRFVLGNNDGEVEGLNKKAAELGFGEINTELELIINDNRIYVYHGTKLHVIDEMAGAQLYDYVIHGHTHHTRNEIFGRTRIINPGALFQANRYTFATLDLETQKVEFIDV